MMLMALKVSFFPLMQAQQQERILAVQQKRCDLTKNELKLMPNQTKMYKSIGRA